MSANPPAGAQASSELKARSEAEHSGRPFLEYRDGDDRQRVFLFEPGSVDAWVGREPSSDLLLGWDPEVSRRHARFERVHGDWLLVDDGLSHNGTWVNGERVSGRRGLNDGDTLRFGTTTMTFRAPEPALSGPAGAGETPAAVVLSTTQRRVLKALCRPYKARFASPATPQQIAEELFLSVGEVKTHLMVLCAKLGVNEQLNNETRVLLVARAFSAGLISERGL
ncbi:MAG: FHA domain-containing protein [Solirubrobacteraceae bacterium]